jgi:hypothetical protein
MDRHRAICLLLFSVLTSACHPPASLKVFSLCDLAKDYGSYRDKRVAVRGVYFYGLQESCSQKCADAPWPSFIWLSGADSENYEWAVLDNIECKVELEAKKGKRFEIWVTATGHLRAREQASPLGPCDRIARGGYGHLGAYPAELVVEEFTNIEVKANPNSPYDYSNIYRGAL